MVGRVARYPTLESQPLHNHIQFTYIRLRPCSLFLFSSLLFSSILLIHSSPSSSHSCCHISPLSFLSLPLTLAEARDFWGGAGLCRPSFSLGCVFLVHGAWTKRQRAKLCQAMPSHSSHAKHTSPPTQPLPCISAFSTAVCLSPSFPCARVHVRQPAVPLCYTFSRRIITFRRLVYRAPIGFR